MSKLSPFVQLNKWFPLKFDRKMELDPNRKKRKKKEKRWKKYKLADGRGHNK
jgi:hypothetical protein